MTLQQNSKEEKITKEAKVLSSQLTSLKKLIHHAKILDMLRKIHVLYISEFTAQTIMDVMPKLSLNMKQNLQRDYIQDNKNMR